VDEMKKRCEIYSGFVGKNEKKEVECFENFDKYVDKMANDSEYGDALTAHAYSNLANTTIHIVESRAQYANAIFEQSSSNKPIYLLYKANRKHYLALIEIKKDS
jgi:hypothetical protein